MNVTHDFFSPIFFTIIIKSHPPLHVDEAHVGPEVEQRHDQAGPELGRHQRHLAGGQQGPGAAAAAGVAAAGAAAVGAAPLLLLLLPLLVPAVRGHQSSEVLDQLTTASMLRGRK